MHLKWAAGIYSEQKGNEPHCPQAKSVFMKCGTSFDSDTQEFFADMIASVVMILKEQIFYLALRSRRQERTKKERIFIQITKWALTKLLGRTWWEKNLCKC